MEYITLKDYAARCGVSYEAVRKSVIRYKKDLGNHLIRKAGCQYLDEDAVKFLTEHRRQNRVVVIREDQNSEIERLNNVVNDLRNRLDILRDELALSQQKRIELQDKVGGLLDDKIKYKLLVTDHEKLTARFKEVEAERDAAITEREAAITEREAAITERDEAIAEAGRYHKSFFGFYRKA